jgi:hypothetical protein
MGADVLLKVGDHLLSMVKILDDKKDGHGEGEKTDQSKDDLKAKALMKLNLSHGIFRLNLRLKRGKGKETLQFFVFSLS